ncbi:hypothetical protein LT85_p037 (plasmid) [Collimonas arenae]|uniref:Uncharacterized protein n=1 Tax=Collimonas arenae TaxID=279058 RepID=A0A0A1FI08_9BURK|nr:hypothetical protein [Collimonas arenae]AIY44216.1 hypothetical protein LT85_p037 [Collimonas arenae]
MKTIPPSRPITSLGSGILFRAIVSLPVVMADDSRVMQDRIVFFESPSRLEPGLRLEKLLAAIWCRDTENWCERGYIYNIDSVNGLFDRAFGDESTGELRLFETGSGGEVTPAVGPDRIHYARENEVDLFVTPRVAGRLRELLDAIEILYAAEPARKKKANNDL